MALHCNGDLEFEVYESYTKSLTSSRAPIFYDTNNTSFYCNPEGESHLGTAEFFYSVNASGGGSWIGRNHAYPTVELLGYGAEFMIGESASAI